MAPKRHGGPAQAAGKGYVKAGRSDERRAFGTSGLASGGEPPDDAAPEEAPDLPPPQVCDATPSTSTDSLPEPEPEPELETMPESAPEPGSETAQPLTAEILPSTAPSTAPFSMEVAVSASASLIGSVAGGLGLAALAGGGIVVIGLGAALGAWHSVAVANRYLSRR